MITQELFDSNVLNIFTDGSIYKHNLFNETIGCPGALAVQYTDNNFIEIDKDMIIRRYSTNNDSEINAILLGIRIAIKNRNYFDKINLFSDSQICIFGLREWIYNWIKCTQNGIMYSSSGTEVANQEVIKLIINLIVEYNLNINFYHQKGHVTETQQSLKNALDVFNKSNKCNIRDYNFIKIISKFNCEVDIFTKDYIQEVLYNTEIINKTNSKVRPIILDSNMIDINKYKKIINGGK